MTRSDNDKPARQRPRRPARPRPRRPARQATVDDPSRGGYPIAALTFDAVIIIDEAGSVVELNPSAEALFGWSADVAVGRPIDELIVPPAYRAQHRRGLARSLDSGRAMLGGRARRLTAMHRDGRVFEIDLRVDRLPGEPARFAGVARPVDSAAVSAAERHAAAEKRRAESMFVASLSHDIRSPLSAIVTLSDLIAHEADPEQLTGHVQRLRTNAESLQGLVADLLDVAMLDVEHLAIEPQAVDIIDLLYGLAESSRSRIDGRPVELRTTFDRQLPELVVTDPRRLRQVAGNLLNNALKMTDQGFVELGARRVSATRERATLQLWVSDTGPGIPAEMAHRLFERFGRAKTGVWAERSGSGLGLSICRALVELIGGTLSFQTEVGRGTTFLIDLDVEIVPAATLDASTMASSIIRLKAPEHRWLLVVDDSEDNRYALGQSLRHRGWTVELAASGRAAVARAMKGRPDAILMDVEMSDMDGLEATAHIRRLESERGESPRPIFALTGHATAEMRTRCLAAGMTGFYTKPFDMNRLHADLCGLVHEDVQPAGDAPAAVDATAKASSFEDLDESIRRHLPAFFANRRNDIEALRVAADATDLDAIRRIDHRLHGTFGLYGMPSLVALVRHIRLMVAAADAAGIRSGIEALSAEMERLAAGYARSQSD